MTTGDNPYQPPIGLSRAHRHNADQNKFGALAQILVATCMLLTPAIVAFLTMGVCQFLDKTLGWDERYVSLSMGFPSAVFAICISAIFWKRGYRVVPIIGALVWTLFCLFAVLVTIAFWGG